MPPKTVDKYHRRTAGAPPEVGEVAILIRLGTTVRKLREMHGWTQAELAEKCERAQTWVSYVERGTRDVGIGSLPLLARVLKTSMSSLLGA